MRSLTLFLFLIAVGVATVSSVALAQSKPEFKLGFKALADQIPDVVGQPTEAEHYGPNGDSLQQTTTGLMVWRKADNWTAFTDGSRTWINGTNGVQSRLNTDRFDWESVGSPANTGGGTTPEESLRDLVDVVVAGWDTVCSLQTCAGWSNTLVQSAYTVISHVTTILNLGVAILQSEQVGRDLAGLNDAIKDYGKSSPQVQDAASTLCHDTQDLHRSLVSTVPGLLLVFPVPDCPTTIPAQPPATPRVTPRQNLLPNPSFELGFNTQSGERVSSWGDISPLSSTMVHSWESGIAHTGQRSVSLTAPSHLPGRAMDTVWYSHQVPISAGKRYRLAVWARGETWNDPNSGFCEFNADAYVKGSLLGLGRLLSQDRFSPSSEWQEYSTEIQQPEGTEGIQVMIIYMSNTPSDRNKVYFDDASLTEIP